MKCCICFSSASDHRRSVYRFIEPTKQPTNMNALTTEQLSCGGLWHCFPSRARVCSVWCGLGHTDAMVTWWETVNHHSACQAVSGMWQEAFPFWHARNRSDALRHGCRGSTRVSGMLAYFIFSPPVLGSNWLMDELIRDLEEFHQLRYRVSYL